MEAIRLLRYKGWSNVGDWKSIKINGIAKTEKLVADESYHRYNPRLLGEKFSIVLLATSIA